MQCFYCTSGIIKCLTLKWRMTRDRKSGTLSLNSTHVISEDKLRYLISTAVTHLFLAIGKLDNSSVGPVFSFVCFCSTSLLKYTIVSKNE